MRQYEIYLVNLDPAIGHEIQKMRPCVIVSPDEMNKHSGTIIIAPMTTKSHKYPTRLEINLQNKKGWIVLDQIRAIDKQRLIKKIGKINENNVRLFQNFSFGTATLDLREKAGFRPLFPRDCGKTIGFWNRLTYQRVFQKNQAF
jgi:mRNA interferase MazF